MENALIEFLASRFPESVRRFHQGAGDAGFADRVSRIGNDAKLRLRPGLVQLPGAHHRTNDVVPPLNDHGGNVTNPANILDQVVVSLKETIVHKVVTLDASQGQRHLWFAK